MYIYVLYMYAYVSGRTRKFKGKVTIFKMGTKFFKIFVCRAYADIKQSDLIVTKQLS